MSRVPGYRSSLVGSDRTRVCDPLAFCDMRTLYLRNVPDEVADRLERLASRNRMSVSAFAVQELTETSRREENLALLNDLPDLGIDRDELLADLDTGRNER